MCLCWTEGTIPSDLLRLARLCEVPVRVFRHLWPGRAPCVQVRGGGLFNPRLERERKKQAAHRDERSDSGKRGAAKRWESHPASEVASHALAITPVNGLAIVQPMAKHSSSSSSSSSSSFKERAHVRASDEDALSQRAGLFVRETYPALYEKFRNGAKYVGKPNLDYLEAMELCRTWDDARLAKIAQVFMTTDHEFAEKGSRTMAQFRSLASWCDSRLREHGL